MVPAASVLKVTGFRLTKRRYELKFSARIRVEVMSMKGVLVKNLILVVVVGSIWVTVGFARDTPYAGQQSRELKSLSAGEIDGYLTGKGMGYAKPAELNHYPGPRHVLDLSLELDLSHEQISASQALFDAMKAQAVALGRELVEKERLLDHHFADGTINSENLKSLIREIGQLEAEIRFVHLSAHLRQKVLLNKQQLQTYDQLRGYGKPGHTGHQHTH